MTGSARLNVKTVRNQVAYLHSVAELPVCVSFRIAHPAEAGAFAPYVDSVVIGSA